MPEFIVETNFFVEAEDAQQAEQKVRADLELASLRSFADRPFPRFVVAFSSEGDWHERPVTPS